MPTYGSPTGAFGTSFTEGFETGRSIQDKRTRATSLARYRDSVSAGNEFDLEGFENLDDPSKTILLYLDQVLLQPSLGSLNVFLEILLSYQDCHQNQPLKQVSPLVLAMI